MIAALDRAVQLKSTYNIRVINLSLGRGVYESYTLDPLCQAVERAWKAGIVVVVAAGNSGRFIGTNGYGTVSAPGNDPFVITVGAMNDKMTTSRADDVMASYSSKGPTLIDHVVKPDLVAPGNAIVSELTVGSALATALPNNILNRSYYVSGGRGLSNYYMKLSGTSMAAPIVSGTAAVMIARNSSLTPNQVKARLMKTATKAFPLSTTYTDPVTHYNQVIQYDMFTVGAGYLDAWAAVNSNDSISAPSTVPLSPVVTYDANTKKTSLVASSLVWETRWYGALLWCGERR